MPLEYGSTSNTVEVFIPMKITKRGGRKWLMLPGANTAKPDDPVVQAIVQAYRWQEKMDSGQWPTMKELAQAEGVDAAELSKSLRLTLLAPDIIEAILKGATLQSLSITDIKRKPFPLCWEEQRRLFGLC